MLYIKHRINKISELKNIHPDWGVEIDLRSHVAIKNKIHLSHDPWVEGDDFELWLQEFKKMNIQGPLILNTKEDGLEGHIIELVEKKFLIQNFFFLDTQIPTLVRWTHKNREKRFAVRFSFYEPEEFVLKFKDKLSWVWLDCFDVKPLAKEKILLLKKYFKVCLVSPELQGGDENHFSLFKDIALISDAICTKMPHIWTSI